jgi:hypothetical protein
MSAKQIRELHGGGIPDELYPDGWLAWANDPSQRVNLNASSVCVDARHAGSWGRACLFIVTGDEYDPDRMARAGQGHYMKHRVNGRPVRVYPSAEYAEPIPF